MAPFTMYSNKKVEKTLDPKFMTPFLRKAQKAEFKELLKVINEINSKLKHPVKILDIGVGDGRVPLLLSKNSIWQKVNSFVGFDNSKLVIEQAKQNIKDSEIKLFYLDASQLDRVANFITQTKYDLIICTYFTAGNFKPDEIKLKTNKEGVIIPYPQNCLKPNKKFVNILKTAFNLLKPGGKIFLGSIYIDSDENRKKQEAFYKKCGMKIITTEKDSFTATEEGFWSQRFSDKSLYKHLSWVDKDKIKIIPLDKYQFAEAVILSNPDI